jgi:predicted acetyltransferase
MKTPENNKLIAEFMDFPDLGTEGDFSYLKYHKSWDRLMPVVDKIENFGYEFIIVENRCYIKHNTDHSVEELFHIETIGSKLDTTYKAVLKFIKEYNKKK